MHQRSFSVSSADQWNEAINTSTSSGARKTFARDQNLSKNPKCWIRVNKGMWSKTLWVTDAWRPNFGDEVFVIAVPFVATARWQRQRVQVFREKGEWRLTCSVSHYNLSHTLDWSAIIYSPGMSKHSHPPILSLPSVVPLRFPPPIFSSFLPERKMNAFWGHHSSPVISLSLWLAVKKHLNAHQQNNSHFHACLHSGSSH